MSMPRSRAPLPPARTVKRPVADQFYGDRTGTLADPFGHVWSLGTHVEDVAPEEMDRRFQEMMKPAATA